MAFFESLFANIDESNAEIEESDFYVSGSDTWIPVQMDSYDFLIAYMPSIAESKPYLGSYYCIAHFECCGGSISIDYWWFGNGSQTTAPGSSRRINSSNRYNTYTSTWHYIAIKLKNNN